MKKLKKNLVKPALHEIGFDQLSQVKGGGGGHDLFANNYDNGDLPSEKPDRPPGG